MGSILAEHRSRGVHAHAHAHVHVHARAHARTRARTGRVRINNEPAGNGFVRYEPCNSVSAGARPEQTPRDASVAASACEVAGSRFTLTGKHAMAHRMRACAESVPLQKSGARRSTAQAV